MKKRKTNKQIIHIFTVIETKRKIRIYNWIWRRRRSWKELADEKWPNGREEAVEKKSKVNAMACVQHNQFMQSKMKRREKIKYIHEWNM